MDAMRRGWVAEFLLALAPILLISGCAFGGKGTSGDQDPPAEVAVLSVTPATLDFGGFTDELAFEVMNTGTGKLVWYVKECCSFADCEPDGGSITLSGDMVTVTVNRREILNPTTGSICIDSNGGELELVVVVDIFEHLYGTVTDGETDAPVEGAVITVGNGSDFTAVSDVIGYYSVWFRKGNLLPIVVTAEGFQDDLFLDGKLVESQYGYLHDVELIPLPGG